ncbi:hypothetical protein [Mucilaginibacter psychrotolerans]|uniref:Uncharacterized protein n=1 Tax=Mucilaginibacter psychrotolerans TaxID=1524096 RepID=A0A4Y8SAI4_9SPHI|nr:hypothetical protein [Mucilaginibacter psychrotolerans]TFF35396.1 hypothetical protein E2R66_19265 [Mucilaginibacter psychrotolerans]
MGTFNAMSARSLQYYLMAKHWASDLEFFKVETSFFKHLIDRYFTKVAEFSGVENLRKIMQKIQCLQDDELLLREALAKQIRQLELMADDFVPENIDRLKGKQIELEGLIANLLEEFRQVKKELFTLIETVMREDEHHIWPIKTIRHLN